MKKIASPVHKIRKVSVIGLGKLGLPMAACFASKGFPTLGIDINEKVVASVGRGIAPFVETGLQELLTSSHRKLQTTTDMARAITETDATFMIVPTPSDTRGAFVSTFVEAALKQLAKALKKSSKPYHLFILNSTVMPGTCDHTLIPLIEKISGRRAGIGFGFSYNPEFIALGSVIHNFMNPDVLLIGENEPAVGDALSAFYTNVLNTKAHVARMSVVSAEIMKISLNAFVTMKISFSNQLARMCDVIPGADVDAITAALGKDARIGNRYLKAGTSYGGPCFPRDNRAFALFAQQHKAQAPIAEAVDKINVLHNSHLLTTVLKHTKKRGTVLVSGIAYKEHTEVIEESAGARLIEELIQRGIKVIAHDSLAGSNIKKRFGDAITHIDTISPKLLSSVNVWVTALPSGDTKQTAESHLFTKPITLIDCWRTIDPSKIRGKVTYVPFGASSRTRK